MRPEEWAKGSPAKRKFLAPSPGQAEALWLDDEAVYSFTDSWTAEQQALLLRSLLRPRDCPDRTVVFDGTAGAGGNTSAFARHFRAVVAIEKRKDTCEALRENLRILQARGSPVDHVGILNQSLETWLEGFRRDHWETLYDTRFLFVDPPWGGPACSPQTSKKLFLGSRSLADVLGEALRAPSVFQHVLLKVPQNFDLDGFLQELPSPPKNVEKFPFRKMHAIVLHYSEPLRCRPTRAYLKWLETQS